MAKSSDDFYEYVLHDVLGHLDGITGRKMFGGYGIYQDGVFFAIIAYDELYFIVGDSNRADYEERGSKPFVFENKAGKKTTMSYWQLPLEIMEDPLEIQTWIDKACTVHDEKPTKKKKS